MLFPVNLPSSILPANIVLDTGYEVRDRLLNTFSQSDGDAVLVDEVYDAQKELLVIYFMFDAESGQRVTV